MKPSIFYQKLLFLAFLLQFGTMQAQVLVNREWENLIGYPDTIRWTTTHIDPLGNIILAGNTQVGGGQTALLITKYDTEGNVIWYRNYQHNGNVQNYATAVVTNANGNIFIAGATGANALSLDFLALALDESGTVLWTEIFNGAANLTDVPTAIALDNAGNTYLTGGSIGLLSQSDYVTIKYDSSGVEQWVSIYDYANFHDAPVGIEVLSNSNIVVTGASASSTNNYDYATIEYNSLGAQINVNRQTVAGSGLDNPIAMEKDLLGNIYITGKVQNGGNVDIRTIKLNDNFVFQWAQTYDNAGLEDVAEGIAIDNIGNVYVTGYTTNVTGDRDLIVLKYDGSGNFIWQQRYSAENNQNAEARDISIDNQGYIYVGGFEERGNTRDFLTIRYSSIGTIDWIKNYGGNGLDEVANIETSGSGDLIVTGRYNDSGTDRYATLKYTSWKRYQGILMDSLNNPSHIQNEIVVRFSPNIVNLDFVDNKELLYARLEDIIPDSVILLMNEKVDNYYDFHTVRVEKIYKRMTTADSISISRLGETVKMQKCWSAFVLILPDLASITIGDDIEKVVCDSLSGLFPLIYHASLDYIGEMSDIPNDDEWTNQFSLNASTPFSNASINIDPAWDIEHGNSSIKVGVYDTGIDWRHPDFRVSGGNPTLQLSDSKIVGGWDYCNNMHVSQMPTADFDGHGTACAGIIGALRNNDNEGIAGIAGGDIDDDANAGCQLFMMKITDDSHVKPLFVPYSKIANSILEGAAFNPQTGFGYGFHIMNHSWNDNKSNDELAQAVRTSFENKCIFSCSRGNFPQQTPAVDDLTFPACYKDEYVINVGGTGANGNWKHQNNGDADPFFDAMIGHNIDIAAPATTSLVRSCDLSTSSSLYTDFNGTSAASPHVAGVVALMLAQQNVSGQYHPDNLAPEDVEFLLQKYATNLNQPNETGAGRLDAGNVMQHLDYPLYRVIHSITPSSTSLATSFNQQILLAEPTNGLAAGWYWGDKYQVTYNYIDILPSSATILDAWPRFSSTNSLSATNPLLSNAFATFTLTVNPNTPNVAVVTMMATCYYITSNGIGQQINGWIPDHYSNLSTAYSLHVFDPQFVSNELVNNEIQDFFVYPNPVTDKLTFTYTQTENTEVSVAILDMAGKVIQHTILPSNLIGANTGNLLVNGLAGGVYVCKLKVGDKVFQHKFVKL